MQNAIDNYCCLVKTVFFCDYHLVNFARPFKEFITRVLNNFDHLETWRPVLNYYFDCEKGRFVFP